jgi:hypothetical protein
LPFPKIPSGPVSQIGRRCCHHRKIFSAIASALRTGALPTVRLIPRKVAFTASEFVGGF